MRPPVINKEELIKALRDMFEVQGISYREMERVSGVHNISRIVSGEIKRPTAESWQLLHQAYPKDIPEPSYIGGENVYRNVITGSNNVTGSGKIGMRKGEILSAEEQSLVNALRELGEDEKKFIRKILATVDDYKENSQK